LKLNTKLFYLFGIFIKFDILIIVFILKASFSKLILHCPKNNDFNWEVEGVGGGVKNKNHLYKAPLKIPSGERNL